MKNVLISIIIPCYNSEKWIVDTLKSLIYKEYEEYEIVFINDGSNDKSLIKAKEFFLTTKLNYRIINQQNSGVSIARNEGIKNARGEYVYFLDSDDRVCNNFFDIVFENIKNKKSDMIFFDYDIVDGDKVVRCNNRNILNQNGDETLKSILDGTLNYHMCSFIIKRSVLSRNNILFTPNCKYGEDNEFIIKALCNCKKVDIIKKTIFQYTLRNTSAVHKFSMDRLDSIYAAKRVENYVLKKINNPIIRELLKQYVGNKLVYNLHQYIKFSNKREPSYRFIKKELFKIIHENREYLKYLNCHHNMIKRRIVYLITSNVNLYYIILLIKKNLLTSNSE